MTEHHATLSPSSLPMLAECQCFEREQGEGPEGLKYRDHGTKMHTAIANLLLGKDSGVALTIPESEQVEWAVNHVRTFSTKAHPIEVEQRLSLAADDFSLITFGTVDVINGDWSVDWKSLEAHDYWYQMACYALMVMQRSGHLYMTVDIGYLKDRLIERNVITRTEATEKLGALFAKIRNPFKKATPNVFCKWCKHITTCAAVAQRALTVVENREDWSPISFRSSEITDPVEMVKAYALAELLGDWADAVKYHAKEMAKHTPLPGMELKEKRGNRKIENAHAAFEALTMIEPEAFLSACSVGVGKLESILAKQEGISTKAASKKLDETLQSLVTRGPSTWQLKLRKTDPDAGQALDNTTT